MTPDWKSFSSALLVAELQNERENEPRVLIKEGQALKKWRPAHNGEDKVETGVSGVWQHAAALVSEQDAEAEQNGETNGSTRVEQHAEAERVEWKRRFRAVTFEQDAEAERAAGGTGSEASE
ncbi:hypothetical protein PIB30_097706 [Stylosanthes scabra]|uniref:Uncharacterized protein n=1 Tax=Stylosanthes scabra TaxID=79078 RepID=A0ABU6WZE6_9FABA|nr:hypothetical protein [Stylosanthes scabra]